METITPYVHRDISWLEFNYRVLQEAKDPTVPLLEKLKFLSIYSSNLDEFFRVRVANHRNLLRIGKKTRRDLGFEPKALLRQILNIVSDQKAEFSEIFFKKILNLEDLKTKEKRLAIVKVPSDELKRFIELPHENEKEHVVIMIDDVVRHCISWIFPGYEIIESYSIAPRR